MDKNLLIFIGVGVGFAYMLNNFLSDIDTQDQYTGTSSPHFEQYYHKDAIGESVLDANGLSIQDQLHAWKQSPLLGTFEELFPNFDLMQQFIRDHVAPGILQEKLIAQVKQVEGDFFAGKIDSETARRQLLEGPRS